MNKIFVLFLILLLPLAQCFGWSGDTASINNILSGIAARNEAMLNIEISLYDKPVYSNAIGYSNIDAGHKVHASVNTCYRIGSITKVFTAIMIFQLIEENELRLTTPLSDFFPDMPGASKITIAHMLGHKSGLHNFTEDVAFSSMLNRRMTKEDMLSFFKTLSNDFEPGSKVSYSNTNFILLGYIAEALDRKSYSQILDERICKRIGLKRTYHGTRIHANHQEANSYKWQNGWVRDVQTNMSIPGGAGAIISTPSDLNKLMNALFAGKLVNDESLSEMLMITNGFGKGLMAFKYNGNAGYGHKGGIDGFHSFTIYFPKEHLAFSYTANAVNTSLEQLTSGVLDTYFHHKKQEP